MAGMLSGENFSQAVLNNNRLAGFGYDAAGNTRSDGVNTYTYDAENQIVSAAGVTYTYDGNGDRVKKSNGRLYWYGAPGIVAESDLSGNLTAEYIFFDGERIARRDLPSGTVHYYFSDHLKSVSVVTSASGTIEEESDYRPWGEEKVILHTLADQHFKFNGKERDTETGFDEFGARLYSSAWSRWLTPDWSSDPTPVPYANMDNPQSLNLYEYALNNPTTLPDLDGHLTPLGSCCGGGQSPVDPQQQDQQQQLAQQTQGAATKQLQFTATGALIGGAVGALVGGTIGAIGGAATGAAGGTLVAPGPGTVVGGLAGGVGGGSVGAGEGAVIGASVGAFVGGSIGYVWSLFSSKSGSSTGQNANSGPKAGQAPGVTAGGQATDAHGNKLGPSGEAQVNKTKSNTREAARNKALNQGPRVVEHRAPRQGRPHFHPADRDGEKTPSSTHHEYPD
jgi:RHS repeat-associated protein